jgi:hypothetical protein
MAPPGKAKVTRLYRSQLLNCLIADTTTGTRYYFSDAPNGWDDARPYAHAQYEDARYQVYPLSREEALAIARRCECPMA